MKWWTLLCCAASVDQHTQTVESAPGVLQRMQCEASLPNLRLRSTSDAMHCLQFHDTHHLEDKPVERKKTLKYRGTNTSEDGLILKPTVFIFEVCGKYAEKRWDELQEIPLDGDRVVAVLLKKHRQNNMTDSLASCGHSRGDGLQQPTAGKTQHIVCVHNVMLAFYNRKLSLINTKQNRVKCPSVINESHSVTC